MTTTQQQEQPQDQGQQQDQQQADDETYTLLIGHVYSTDSLESAMTEYFAELVEERTRRTG